LNTAQDEEENKKTSTQAPLDFPIFSQDMGNSSLCQEGGGSYLDLPTSLPGTVTDKGSEAQERAWFVGSLVGLEGEDLAIGQNPST